MRIWDVDPAELCRAHLLGEHRELHGLWNILTQDKRGYRQHPETKRWEGKLAALYDRHEALVAEMAARGYGHRSPLDRALATGAGTQDAFVDDIATQRRMLKAKPCPCHTTTLQEDAMTQNRRTVERYMEAFARLDHDAVLSCLADDVEWILPGAYHHRGKEAFDREIENEAFTGAPLIRVDRLLEAGDVIVAEGRVRANPREGGHIHLAFVDVFDMRDGLIRRLVSYLMPVPAEQESTRWAGAPA